MLCIETSTYLGYLHKFEGAAGEFKGAPGSQHPLILSPEYIEILADSIIPSVTCVHILVANNFFRELF